MLQSWRLNTTNSAAPTQDMAAATTLRRAIALDAQRRLRRGETRHRHAVRRARHVIQTDLLAELDRRRIAAMLAANAKFQIGLHRAAFFRGDAHHFADALDVDRDERILGQDTLFDVLRQELAGIVARQPEDGLRQ